MTHALPTERDPTHAEWQAFVDALPSSSGPTPPVQAEAVAAGAAGVSTDAAPAAPLAGAADGGGGDRSASASPNGKPAAWLRYLEANPSPPDEMLTTPEGVPVPLFTPWQATRARARGWSPVMQRWFIVELTRIGSARAAAAAVGKSVQSAYALRAKFGAESFAAAWDEAVIAGRQGAEQVAISRALHGEMVPQFRAGKFTGYKLRRNDRLLVAALGSSRTRRSRDPALDEYRDGLERWEMALNRRMLDLEQGVYLPDDRVGEAWDARQAWERAAVAERRRIERRRIEAHARATVRRGEARAAVAPRVRLP